MKLDFNTYFLRDLWQLLKPFWMSEEKFRALWLLSLSIGCTVLGVRANVELNVFFKDFYDSLQNFNEANLFTLLFKFILILMTIVVTQGYSVYLNGLLSIHWRKWLTNNYLTDWLHCSQLKSIDNPDQRISEDLEKLPEITIAVFFILLQSILTLCSFCWILWHLSGNLSISLGTIQLSIPGYFCWSALIYGLLGTWITLRIGRKLANLDYEQQRYNADFRYSLVQIREGAKNNPFNQLFMPIFNNFLKIISIKKYLVFFDRGYNTAAYIIGTLLAIPLYMQRQIQIGGIMQVSGGFSSIVGAFSLIIGNFHQFAEWRAVTARLIELKLGMQLSKMTPPIKAAMTTQESYK